jgi:hypothetical protein
MKILRRSGTRVGGALVVTDSRWRRRGFRRHLVNGRLSLGVGKLPGDIEI